MEFNRNGEREEQDGCTSPSASPQQPKARQGECRGWETSQQPLENGLPQERATQGVERGGGDGGQREKQEREGQGQRRRHRGETEGENIRKGSRGEKEVRENSEGG